MANWCSNSVVFMGEHGQLTDLKILFEAMARKEHKQRKGQLPDFIFEKDGYFFDVVWDNDVLSYQTRWAPNTAIIMEIAVRFEVEFIHSYEESANLIYGQATYLKGEFIDICLDSEDFDQYTYDDAADNYTFEGEVYESNSEILESILERKIAIKTL